MAKRLFSKQDLRTLLEYENGEVYTSETGQTYKVVHTERLDDTRWSAHYWQVFEFCGDKLYQTFYSVGLTECQDERPYEYENDFINCEEVVEKVEIIQKVDYVLA